MRDEDQFLNCFHSTGATGRVRAEQGFDQRRVTSCPASAERMIASAIRSPSTA